MHAPRSIVISSLAALSLVLMTSCTAPAPSQEPSGAAAEATSAAELGGMDKLISAAKKEGELNVIALPPDWANYGEMIETFSDKYDIKVNSTQPDATSEDEINAAKRLKGQSRAPDTFDLGSNVALVNTDLFAPYKVKNWDSVPEDLKSPEGKWTNNYTGYMSIGYDASKVPAPKSVNDLLGPKYKGKIALNGDPLTASAGFHGVVMAAVANGGAADNLAPGLKFFKKLHESGNLLPVDPTPATIKSGQTPVVIDWDYNNTAAQKDLESWKVVVPKKAVVGAFYTEAVNKNAPHPAAARLWVEFVFSPEGQNIWLSGAARPVLLPKMEEDGTVNKKALKKLPGASGEPVVLDQQQLKKGQKYLSTRWSKAVG